MGSTPTRGTTFIVEDPKTAKKWEVSGYTPRNNPGLVVHRTVRFLGDAIDYGHRWTVSHKRSGYTLLSQSTNFKTKKDAVEFCDRIASVDWDREREELVNSDLRMLVSDALKVASTSKGTEETKPKKAFYVRSSDRRGFEIVNGSGEVVETHLHRGLAADRANKLRRES